MRYQPEHKNKSRAHILGSAAAQLRARGVETVRLADMMHAAGMTNGGFYKHFHSKDEVVVEAIARALTEVAEQLLARVQNLPRRDALRTVIEFYLSEPHLQHPERGCAFAALGSELARMPLRLRRRIIAAIDHYQDTLSPIMPGDSDEQRRTAFVVLFSSMAGCLTAARAEADELKRSKILKAGREFFIQTFCVGDEKSLGEIRQ